MCGRGRVRLELDQRCREDRNVNLKKKKLGGKNTTGLSQESIRNWTGRPQIEASQRKGQTNIWWGRGAKSEKSRRGQKSGLTRSERVKSDEMDSLRAHVGGRTSRKKVSVKCGQAK